VLLTVGDKVNISVCDLGLLREKKVDVFMTMNIGTPYYQAPELLY
jgi:serine/threonine protein kinase